MHDFLTKPSQMEIIVQLNLVNYIHIVGGKWQ